MNMFVGPADVPNDGFDGSSVAFGLSNPIYEDQNVERLTVSNDLWHLLLWFHHHILEITPLYLSYFMFLLY